MCVEGEEEREKERERDREKYDSPGDWQCAGMKVAGLIVVLQAAHQCHGVVGRAGRPDQADPTVPTLCGLCLLVGCRANRIETTANEQQSYIGTSTKQYKTGLVSVTINKKTVLVTIQYKQLVVRLCQ